MIVTFTPNPSLDRSAMIDGQLTRGMVHRMGPIAIEPGGKGVNVSRALVQAGHPTVAVIPADPVDELVDRLDALGVPRRAVPTGSPVRANTTLTEADGTTTKLNAPGSFLSPALVEQLTEALLDEARGADWVVLSGSLPPGAPANWYVRLVTSLREIGTKVAVDTSGAPLTAMAQQLSSSVPHLVKPNSHELGQLCGRDGNSLEQAASMGNWAPVLGAARELLSLGVETVLVTLGAAGALLVTLEGAWRATTPPMTVVSTVGAGDAAMAGYLLADLAGLSAADRLRTAVAHGAGAISLPGSQLPSPSQTHPELVEVTALI